MSESQADRVPTRKLLHVLLRQVDRAAYHYAGCCRDGAMAYWRHGPYSGEYRRVSDNAQLADRALREAVDDLGQEIGRLP